MYGLSTAEWDELQHIFVNTSHIGKVILYGSRAKGNYRPFSDVDITLEGDALTDDDVESLNTKLYYSSLPYQFDVSRFTTLTNASLIDHIRRCGKVIYDRRQPQ